MFDLFCLLVLEPLKWLLGKFMVRWDRTVDSWGPSPRQNPSRTRTVNGGGPQEGPRDRPVPAADIRALRSIAGDAWWSPENEREADSQRWLLQHGLIVDGPGGLLLTPEGRRLIEKS